MTFSIYRASVPVYTRRLEALSTVLDKAAAYGSQRKIDPAGLIQARLYPDMFPLARQVQISCGHAMPHRSILVDTFVKRSGQSFGLMDGRNSFLFVGTSI